MCDVFKAERANTKIWIDIRHVGNELVGAVPHEAQIAIYIYIKRLC